MTSERVTGPNSKPGCECSACTWFPVKRPGTTQYVSFGDSSRECVLARCFSEYQRADVEKAIMDFDDYGNKEIRISERAVEHVGLADELAYQESLWIKRRLREISS